MHFRHLCKETVGRILRLSIVTGPEIQLHAVPLSRLRSSLNLFSDLYSSKTRIHGLASGKNFKLKQSWSFSGDILIQTLSIRVKRERGMLRKRRRDKTHPQCGCGSSQKRGILPCLYNGHIQDAAASKAITFGGWLRNLNVMTMWFMRGI